jgi:hypothetical protein
VWVGSGKRSSEADSDKGTFCNEEMGMDGKLLVSYELEEDGVVRQGEWWCGCRRADRIASKSLRVSLSGKKSDSSPWIGLTGVESADHDCTSHVHGMLIWGKLDG